MSAPPVPCPNRGIASAGCAARSGARLEMRDPKAIPRAQRRTMSRMSIYAVQATVEALRHAGIDPLGIPENPRFGCIMGSTTGSPDAITKTYETLLAKEEYMHAGSQ